MKKNINSILLSCLIILVSVSSPILFVRAEGYLNSLSPDTTSSEVALNKSDENLILKFSNQLGLNLSSSDPLATFADVPTTYWAYQAIEKLYQAGITGGCDQNPLRFCPNLNVTRAEMAKFLLTAINGSGYEPSVDVSEGTSFTDVAADYWAAAWIEQLYQVGLTSGCSSVPLMFCPNAKVTRAEMAKFLIVAMYADIPDYKPVAVEESSFEDVPATYWAKDWIEELYEEGVTTGCSLIPHNYCPENNVTRAEMAVFLVRAFVEPVIPPLPQGQELANAYAGMYAGTVVTMAGPFTDQNVVIFNGSIAAFEEATGIDIQYEGSNDFEANIMIRLDGGDRPDIVDFPQPGLLQTAVDKGYAIDMETLINPSWIEENYSQAWQDLATMNGMVAGIWARANGKSFVFYPKAKFEEYGYTIPETWDEMMALTEEIAADGDTPWCIGIESGVATGWTMTDWIEDVLLRIAPPEDYDAWVDGELPFDSPQVNEALDYIEEIWFNDDYVYGGRAAIPTIFFGDAPLPMFENPPGCWFNRQGNFVTSFFPEELEAGVDYDFFYLPPIKEELGKPVLGAGDIYAVFDDRPEVRAVIQYFSTGESLKYWIEVGGAIGVHNDASLDWYADPVTRGVAETIRNATTFRFDGSDLMPSAVGAGTFWKYMTDYVSGTITREEALQLIDASWPD